MLITPQKCILQCSARLKRAFFIYLFFLYLFIYLFICRSLWNNKTEWPKSLEYINICFEVFFNISVPIHAGFISRQSVENLNSKQVEQ